MSHTADCIALQGKYEQQRDEYKKHYPDYCTACEGRGYHVHTENGAPMGAGFWAMEIAEVCSHCSERGLCPGCKQPVFSIEDIEKMDGSGQVYCEQCGWVDDGKHEMPEVWDCWGYCHRKG